MFLRLCSRAPRMTSLSVDAGEAGEAMEAAAMSAAESPVGPPPMRERVFYSSTKVTSMLTWYSLISPP